MTWGAVKCLVMRLCLQDMRYKETWGYQVVDDAGELPEVMWLLVFLASNCHPHQTGTRQALLQERLSFAARRQRVSALISSFESTLQADEKVDGVADPRRAHNSGASYRLAWKAIVAQYSMCGTEYMIQCTMIIREDADG